jgi:hypothetical protein
MASSSPLGIAVISVNHPLCKNANLKLLAKRENCSRFSLEDVPESDRYAFKTRDTTWISSVKPWISRNKNSRRLIIDGVLDNLTKLEMVYKVLRAYGFDVAFVWFDPVGSRQGHDSDLLQIELEHYGQNLYPAKPIAERLGMVHIELDGDENEVDVLERISSHDLLRGWFPTISKKVVKDLDSMPSATFALA